MHHCKANIIVSMRLKVWMESLGSLYSSCIWTYNNQVVFVYFFCLKEIGKACKGCFVVFKLTLRGNHTCCLQAMQVNGYNSGGSHEFNYLGNITWRYWGCFALCTAILSCITIVRCHYGDWQRAISFACWDHCHQFHEWVIDRATSWLYDITMLSFNTRFRKLTGDLSISKFLWLSPFFLCIYGWIKIPKLISRCTRLDFSITPRVPRCPAAHL